MNLLDYLVPFALALGLLILVHELGHYLVARWCGVKVLRFSIGFGKPLIVKRAGRDDTEWSLAAFPLGGYVKMLDEREGPVAPAELHRSFNRQNVYRRFAIVEWPELENEEGWFLLERGRGMHALNRKDLEIDAWVDPETKTYKALVNCRFGGYVDDIRYACACNTQQG